MIARSLNLKEFIRLITRSNSDFIYIYTYVRLHARTGCPAGRVERLALGPCVSECNGRPLLSTCS